MWRHGKNITLQTNHRLRMSVCALASNSPSLALTAHHAQLLVLFNMLAIARSLRFTRTLSFALLSRSLSTSACTSRCIARRMRSRCSHRNCQRANSESAVTWIQSCLSTARCCSACRSSSLSPLRSSRSRASSCYSEHAHNAEHVDS